MLTRSAFSRETHALEVTAPVQVFLAVVVGALLSAGYALHPTWWAPWFAPVLLLVAASGPRLSPRSIGAMAGALAMTSLLSYYVEMIGWPATLVIAVLRAISWMLAVRLTVLAARYLSLAGAVFVLPSTIAAFELLALQLSPHGAAGSLAYSQMDMPGVVQIATLGGVCAVVFLVLLPGSLVGLCLSRRSPRAALRSASALVSLIVLPVVLFSVARIRTPLSGSTVPVTLISTNQYDGVQADWADVWNTYRPAVLRSATTGGLVVLPEKLVLLDQEDAARAAADVIAAARVTGAAIVVGLETRARGSYYNRALLAAPNGHATWYDKQRLIPGWEDRNTPGQSPVFLEVMDTRVGIAICKDMHIPEIGRQYAGHAAIMVVPAYDFGGDAWMGARMTALRAVENGYAVARSARNGLVSAYDRTGRVLVEYPVGDSVTIATTVLPAAGASTVYGRIGNAFGWVCLGGSVVLWIWLSLAQREERLMTLRENR
ncbi:MAG TPA: nitrilase-related carbon-nitrogen hydrolase [Rhodothermales bacterium]|nr:nitrilase-related carbon-nitrogen hydrolase [Rhodothermales bacterium]